MPQTIVPRLHRTITLAANDLCSVSYTGRSSGGSCYMKNLGPGKVYVSFDSANPAAVGNVNCLMLAVNDFVTFTGLDLSAALTLNADTASTIVTMTFGL
jgi:hypothetical protein